MKEYYICNVIQAANMKHVEYNIDMGIIYWCEIDMKKIYLFSKAFKICPWSTTHFLKHEKVNEGWLPTLVDISDIDKAFLSLLLVLCMHWRQQL